MEFHIDVYDNPIHLALELKRTHPNAAVFVVQDTAKLDAVGIDSFDELMGSEQITVIHCNEINFRGRSQPGENKRRLRARFTALRGEI